MTVSQSFLSRQIIPQVIIGAATCLLSTGLLSGCASMTRHTSESTEANQAADSNAEMKKVLTSLAERVETLESKLSTMNDKVDATRMSVEQLVQNQRVPQVGVSGHPSQATGTEVSPSTAATDPEAGFVNDRAVQAYRKAKLLFDGAKYPEAILGFSTFLENYADHALAGSAQYHIGEAYFKQREYKLALQEYERVLTSYDRSSRVPDTLKAMAEAEDHLGLAQAATKHRQLLTSLFPQSPAASTAPPAEAAPAGKTNLPQQSPNKPSSATPAGVEHGSNSGLDDVPMPTAPLAGAHAGAAVSANAAGPEKKEGLAE